MSPIPNDIMQWLTDLRSTVFATQDLLDQLTVSRDTSLPVEILDQVSQCLRSLKVARTLLPILTSGATPAFLTVIYLSISENSTTEWSSDP